MPEQKQMGSFRLTADAERDLSQIWLYGRRQWEVDAANKFYSSLLKEIPTIADHPYRSPKVDNLAKGCRRGVYKNYSIYYEVKESVVIVVGTVGRQSIATRDWTTYS